MSARIVFITGTDTGVGKTVLTSLLLCYLQQQGARALALKPFCSGSRADAELLHRLQEDNMALEEINPFYFPEPVAPLISGRKHHRTIRLEEVIDHINSIAKHLSETCLPGVSRHGNNSRVKADNYLLIEGSGGLLVPLGEGYAVSDLIARIRCEVLVVSRNKLGTINHTLLTVNALKAFAAASTRRSPSTFQPRTSVVLMNQRATDISSRTNPAILRELLAPTPLIPLPFLGPHCTVISTIKRNAQKLHKCFGEILHRGGSWSSRPEMA